MQLIQQRCPLLFINITGLQVILSKKGNMMIKHQNILMGVGNILRGDDGIGSIIAKSFNDNDWLSLDCGVVPENFTSIIKKNKPALLVILDVVEMDLNPGELRIISPEKISELHLTTHSMPLSFLINYLSGYVGNIIFLGIQPENINFSNSVSLEVSNSAKTIVKILKNKQFNLLKVL